MIDIFFNPDWVNILGIAITAPLLYILMIVYIRVVGKRATSQMNNFDWIVTVAIGSLVGSTIILKDISIFDGAFAIGLLLAMQYAVTKLMCKSKRMQRWIKSSPTILVYEGEMIRENMYSERILESEINAAIREKGPYELNDILAVIIESDAKLSVIPKKLNAEHGFIRGNVTGIPKNN